ncbi:hypothetical protein TrVFT333_006266 [Trichoderma virens FT-333]|nr:hypothetical protein TrVFT333_006266 [Trichoderma virens FT-333]
MATHHEPEDEPEERITDLLAWGNDVEIVELDKSGHVQQQWLHAHDGHVLRTQLKNRSNGFFSRSAREWRKVLFDSFLPVGFPHSVSKDYLAYQMFDSLQAFFQPSALFLPIAPCFKDAMSRIATIVFAHRFGLRIEPDAKRYRFLADIFNDSAFFLELYSPYLGSWGKVIALSTGEALRALCGVAAGASKAALSVHFARQDNLAELNAKEASQETAVGLIGLLVGTLVVKTIEDHSSVVILMILLVFAHLGMNYLGVRSVCMTTLNRQRATILFSEYLKNRIVLTPEQVAERESIIFWSPIMRNIRGKKVVYLEFAESYGHAMSCSDPHDQLIIVDGIKHTRFICSRVPKYLTPIKMLLWEGAQPIDAIRAWFASMEIAWMVDNGGAYTQKLDELFCDAGVQGNGRKFSIAGRDRDSEFVPQFSNPDLWDQMAQKGWNLEAQALETKAPTRLQIRKKRAKNM